MPATPPRVPSLLARREQELLADWHQAQLATPRARPHLKQAAQLREQSREFLSLLRTAVAQNRLTALDGHEWTPVREFLASISRTRAQQGFTPAETAMFVFSLKQPIFNILRKELANDAERLAEQLWLATTLLDQMGLITMEAYQ